MSDADTTRPDNPDAGSSSQMDQTPGQTSPSRSRSNPDHPTDQVDADPGRSVEWNGEVHPLAASYPDIKGDPFDELAADIKHNGLFRPIMLDYRGTLIDGRQRLRACQAAGVPPTFAVLSAGDDVVAYIVSANQHRRHLTANQRAAAALEIKRFLDQREPRKVGRPKKSSREAETTRRGGQISRHQTTNAARAAAATGASESSVYKLEALEAKAPDLADEVKRDEKSLSAATREAKARATHSDQAEPPVTHSEPDSQGIKNRVAAALMCGQNAVGSAQRFREYWGQIDHHVNAEQKELLARRADEVVRAWTAAVDDVRPLEEDSPADLVDLADGAADESGRDE